MNIGARQMGKISDDLRGYPGSSNLGIHHEGTKGTKEDTKGNPRRLCVFLRALGGFVVNFETTTGNDQAFPDSL